MVGWLQEHEKFILPVLEPIPSYFSIPTLNDKPQDPIIQTIQSPVQSQGLTPPHNSPSPALSHPNGSSHVSVQVSKPMLTPLWNEVSLHRPQDVVSMPFVIPRGVI